MANVKTKKSVKSAKSVKKVVAKRVEHVCECCANDSVKYTRVWAAWRAFWRRGFCEWSGTSSRSEYWLSWIGNLIIFALGGLIVGAAALAEMQSMGHPGFFTILFGTILVFYGIACIIPAISMMTRRMHDAGLSAWLWLVYALSIAPVWTGEEWVYGTGIGLVVALLPTQMHGNPYHKNNR